MAWWRWYEGPTWLLAVVIYGAWAALTWWHASIPWWVMMPVGAYLVAWHFSFQHETIHAMRHVPRWIRYALAYPPLGLWFPYPIYNRSHSKHHIDPRLTDPEDDPETYYHSAEAWRRMSSLTRGVFMANQTFAGRLVLGPFLRLWRLVKNESRRLARGDYANVRDWVWHGVAVGLLFGWISGICDMPWWQYVLLVAWPAMSLGFVRGFIEHRAAPSPGERVAACEAGFLMSLLFLWNNLHIAHHVTPTIPWYELPTHYRANRPRLLGLNDNFVFPGGYVEIARRWFLKPVFVPVHPQR